jgi:hypothetical protein
MYFLTGKISCSENQKRCSYTVLSKLTDFLFGKKLVTTKEKKATRKTLSNCRAVDSEKIIHALHELHAQGYWKSLEQERDDDDDAAVYSGYSDKEDESVEADADGETPMRVRKVTEEGSIFAYADDEFPHYRSDDEDSIEEGDGVLLRLPTAVAKLGRKRMEMLCMNLALRRGVWPPYNPHDTGNLVCANVYPPSW